MGDKPEFVVVAEKFFEACETGKGSAATSDYTSEGATFSGQVVADAFKGIETLSAYADWMNGLANGIMPGCSYTLHSLTWNSSKQVVVTIFFFISRKKISPSWEQDRSILILFFLSKTVLRHFPWKTHRRQGTLPRNSKRDELSLRLCLTTQ